MVYVTHPQPVGDFDICKDFVLMRCLDKFYKYHFKEKLITEVTTGKDKSISMFSILACGHSYLIGVSTKKRRREI